METAERKNNIAMRIVLIMLTALFIIGIGLFDYACYAAEECTEIGNSFVPATSQTAHAGGRVQ